MDIATLKQQKQRKNPFVEHSANCLTNTLHWTFHNP